jgi:hypothetical protein
MIDIPMYANSSREEKQMRPETTYAKEILKLHSLGFNIESISNATGKSRGWIEYIINKYNGSNSLEFIASKEKQMKRIDIRKEKYYNDGNIEICKDGIVVLKGITLQIDKDYLSLAQANAILAPFGYELYQSTDWTKAEVGAHVHKLNKLWGEPYCVLRFYDYIPNTNQVLVMENNYVKVYNEDEVELI